MSDVLLFKSLPDYIRDAVDGGASRCLCPKCAGGTSRELSLSIRQQDTGVTTLKCYRASCGWFATSMTDSVSARLVTKSLKVATPYRDAILPLSTDMERRLVDEYQCSVYLARGHGWGVDERGSAIVMPVRDPYGRERGHVTRTFTKPKRCFTFKATAQPWQDWWLTQNTYAATVVVEDCISALRVCGLGYNAVALLGTSMSTEMAKEIAKHSPGGVILALDRDAFDKSLSMARRHSHILRMSPICLDADLKNVASDEEIRLLLGPSNG